MRTCIARVPGAIMLRLGKLSPAEYKATYSSLYVRISDIDLKFFFFLLFYKSFAENKKENFERVLVNETFSARKVIGLSSCTLASEKANGSERTK